MSLNKVSMSLFPIFDCQFVLLIPVARAPITESSLVMRNPFSIGNWKSAMPSLVSQRHQRIDFRRAPRGDVTGQQSNYDQHKRDRDKRQRIGRAHSIKQAVHQSRSRESSEQANQHSSRYQPQPLTDDQPQHISGAGPERHADADLMSPLTDREGQRPIQSAPAQRQYD